MQQQISPSSSCNTTRTVNHSNRRDDHIIYDPYYCNGLTKQLLLQLGFHSNQIVHEKRDFYLDVSNNAIPYHHTLITNPPYSNIHKEKCLRICVLNYLNNNRPFLLLMPNYIATKQYYHKIINEFGRNGTGNSKNGVDNYNGDNNDNGNRVVTMDDIAYIVPSIPYEYEHPDGTGKDTPPFQSLWYCCIGKENVQKVQKVYEDLGNDSDDDTNEKNSNRPRPRPQFVASLNQLERLGIIKTENRKNPRQRKKLQKRKQQQLEPPPPTQQQQQPRLSRSRRQPSKTRTTAVAAAAAGPSSLANNTQADQSPPISSSCSDGIVEHNNSCNKNVKRNDNDNNNNNNHSNNNNSSKKRKKKKNSRYRGSDGKRIKARF